MLQMEMKRSSNKYFKEQKVLPDLISKENFLKVIIQLNSKTFQFLKYLC